MLNLTLLPSQPTGPMLSDLINLDEILQEVSFEGKLGEPLRPFEQLMGCMPPSQAHCLPTPYRKFMTDPDSPIIDFYPQSFTIDMNGKRWPWEAVTLLPFIDSKRLLEVSATVDEMELTEGERARNSFGEALVISHDPQYRESLDCIGATEGFQEVTECTAKMVPLKHSPIEFQPTEKAVLEPRLVPGVEIPLAGFGALRDAPVQSLWRRKLGIDVFSSRSRYKTACLEMSNLIPALPPIEDLAQKLVGTSVFINYPYFLEGFVTAVSDESCTIRGGQEVRKWTKAEATAWRLKRDGLARRLLTGEGLPGTGGLIVPDSQPITLSVRPFKQIIKKRGGNEAKVYAKFELEVPIIATFWNPTNPDPRLEVPPKLEKDKYDVPALAYGHEGFNRVAPASPSRRLFPPRKPSPAKVQTATFSHWTKVEAASKSLSIIAVQPSNRRIFSSTFCEGGLFQRLETRPAWRAYPRTQLRHPLALSVRPTLLRQSAKPPGFFVAGCLLVGGFFFNNTIVQS